MIHLSWLVKHHVLLSEVTELWTYEDVEAFSVELQRYLEEAGALQYHVVNIHVYGFPLTTNFSRMVGYFKDIPSDTVGEMLLIVPHPTMRIILTSVAYILRWKHTVFNTVEEAYAYIEQETDFNLESVQR
ncbi:MAG: hypothetical protein AAF653_06955 [Chloroflexota bacterium]